MENNINEIDIEIKEPKVNNEKKVNIKNVITSVIAKGKASVINKIKNDFKKNIGKIINKDRKKQPEAFDLEKKDLKLEELTGLLKQVGASKTILDNPAIVNYSKYYLSVLGEYCYEEKGIMKLEGNKINISYDDDTKVSIEVSKEDESITISKSKKSFDTETNIKRIIRPIRDSSNDIVQIQELSYLQSIEKPTDLYGMETGEALMKSQQASNTYYLSDGQTSFYESFITRDPIDISLIDISSEDISIDDICKLVHGVQGKYDTRDSKFVTGQLVGPFMYDVLRTEIKKEKNEFGNTELVKYNSRSVGDFRFGGFEYNMNTLKEENSFDEFSDKYDRLYDYCKIENRNNKISNDYLKFIKSKESIYQKICENVKNDIIERHGYDNNNLNKQNKFLNEMLNDSESNINLNNQVTRSK